jgi:hypothetical protein
MPFEKRNPMASPYLLGCQIPGTGDVSCGICQLAKPKYGICLHLALLKSSETDYREDAKVAKRKLNSFAFFAAFASSRLIFLVH